MTRIGSGWQRPSHNAIQACETKALASLRRIATLGTSGSPRSSSAPATPVKPSDSSRTRAQAGFEVVDRIEARWTANDEIREAILEHHTDIAAAVLAKILEEADSTSSGGRFNPPRR
ncbi:hypothetical protein N8J89_12685 [Crossiella sp. CA-258035]|uniref:hypothetical protein n=1 Tax=Crossiella sp. CA-258035 TaxID=2981138 RepID=UPI0024BCE950|nr:hypothetical protein [Crossiella sp. CA-258035]WHT21877.1 hypothetical protein N8J89_12685 [Crossiella sp. CA-258035]